ncbi:SDR family oxidoreductase [Kaistia nematophila]|uniref:SDR family oxidoreductase n=1 Tax=Kaistia nematophila TaxID=2994654 RepID=A0A9X3IIQ7_9HYPH|nr:SDR family oxidoreductase [Kaistia nematophila]MCX5567739.1 SDR family oxidoreductase [Kaistia nematophila]
MTEKHLFIFGLGFSGQALAQRAKGDYATVGGTVRTEEKAARLRAKGIDALVFDGESASDAVVAATRRATHIVQSIAPGSAGDPVITLLRGAILGAEAFEWLGYLSTVGVYGDHGGGWVDEATEPNPLSSRSVERVRAEMEWRILGEERGVPVALFRLSGIYGPGRNALAQVMEGTARRLVKPGQVFNRIHVADIATAVAAGAAQKASGVFNVTDDEPGPPQDVVAFAAGLAGQPAPPEIDFATAELSPMARSFYGENKRVGNRRLAADLGVKLAFPTYREGIAALWNDGSWRGSAG